MKKVFLLTILSGALMTANAQSLEIGVGGGFSTNTAPSDNMVYKSDQSLINYALNLKVIHTTYSNWQIGFDAHVLELSGKTTKRFEGMPNPYLGYVGGDNKKLVYAKYAVSGCLVGNKAFMFNNNRSYIYLGVAAGYASARNESHNYKPNEGYKAADGGRGPVIGGQVGYVASLSERVGLNLDVAVRNYHFSYDAGAPQVFNPPTDIKYSITAFPITVGIRYFISRGDANAVPRSAGLRPMGRAMR